MVCSRTSRGHYYYFQMRRIFKSCIKDEKPCIQSKGNSRINDASTAPLRGCFTVCGYQICVLQKGELLLDRWSFFPLFFPPSKNLLCGCMLCFLHNIHICLWESSAHNLSQTVRQRFFFKSAIRSNGNILILRDKIKALRD